MKARVTIKDIAKKSKCSYSTVSRALQDSPKISAAVKKKIVLQAKKMGYQPDPFLSALSAYRNSRRKTVFKSKIMFVYSEYFPEADPRTSPYTHASYKGVEAEAHRLGYIVDILKLPKAPELQIQTFKTMRYQGVNGYIFLHYKFDADELTHGDFTQTAMVNMLGEGVHPTMPTVDMNRDETMTLAFQKLLEKGYRRIGYIDTTNQRNLMVHGLIRTYLYQCYQHNLFAQIPILTIEGAFQHQKIPAWIEEHRIDAFIYRGGEDLCPFIDTWQVKRKKKTGYVGLEILDHSKGCSGTSHCRDILGEQAMQLIHRQLTFQYFPPMSYPQLSLILPHWVEGRTY